METIFTELKAEILRRAKDAKACTEQYRRAYKSETVAELMQVIKDNFSWCFKHDVIDIDLILKYKDEFNTNDIWANESVSRGFLLCGNATVEAWGNSYCTSYTLLECKLSDNAIYRVRSTNTIYYTNDDIRFEKQSESATSNKSTNQ